MVSRALPQRSTLFPPILKGPLHEVQHLASTEALAWFACDTPPLFRYTTLQVGYAPFPTSQFISEPFHAPDPCSSTQRHRKVCCNIVMRLIGAAKARPHLMLDLKRDFWSCTGPAASANSKGAIAHPCWLAIG